jgi:hypothetical protein
VRYCRDCCRALVTGRDALGEPVCRCALGCWGPESWPVALVAPSCADFELAAEQPDDLVMLTLGDFQEWFGSLDV